MREKTARAILLIKAIEEADQQKEVLTDDDRKFASRTARELAHWQAAETRTAATLPNFLYHRADQLLKRLASRHKLFAGVAKGHSGMWGASWLLPLAALLVGSMAESFGDPHRVDLLSLPLLGIIAWNMLVYVLIVAWALLPARRAGLRRGQQRSLRRCEDVVQVAVAIVTAANMAPASKPHNTPFHISAHSFQSTKTK